MEKEKGEIKTERYDAKKVEEKWRKYWDKEGIYKFNAKSGKKIYSIDTPPPTVSGKMHIGHAFSYSQQDFIARFHRMRQGVFYPFGTDDNGLPTEKLVERLNKVKSKEMSRANFISLCLKTLREITPDFIGDWKKLGISADYNIYYSTIDENSRRLSQKSFIELFNKKEIYKKEFPTIWCPECQTSIAQAELEDKEEESLFSTLKFKVNGKDLLIATTRPELLSACVAVFVHPQDARYNSLIGKKAKVPLFDYEVPILADKSADMQKGTGILMICSYGDRFDVDAIQRHKLKPRMILKDNGKLNFPGYEDLKVKEAREKILRELEKKGLIKEQKSISHVINIHDKCGAEIEFLQKEQWFIKVLDKKQKLIEQGRKINWHPAFMKKRYENWINGLEWDWSISRDRHFGVPIPVWHCEECGEVIVAKENELPIDPIHTGRKCPKCKKDAIPEHKVLDTWMTSSLTPQIASSLIHGKIKIPFSLRPQAHDIIRTWAFYTITKSYLHEKSIPWKDIMVSGFVTLKGEKMSKSKGNVISPQQVIEKYSADALRFWAAGSKLGEDLDYQEKDLVTGSKFVTKLSNAAKFVFMSLKDYLGKKPARLEKLDGLFLGKLDSLIKNVTVSFENYEYNRARAEVESFFWHDFCDNYLEIIKNRVYNAKGKEKESAQYTLYQTLLAILKMIAPIMPFITEEIYHSFFLKYEKEKSIHVLDWPEPSGKGKEGIAELDLFISLLQQVRQKKTEAKKSMKAEIVLYLGKQDLEKMKGMLEDLKTVVNAKEIKEGKGFKVEFV